MLGVDEGGGTALLLAFGDGLQGQRGFAGRFRPVDLHHPPLGQAADPQCQVKLQGAGGNGFDHLRGAVAHAHHRAFAELLFDLAQGG